MFRLAILRKSNSLKRTTTSPEVRGDTDHDQASTCFSLPVDMAWGRTSHPGHPGPGSSRCDCVSQLSGKPRASAWSARPGSSRRGLGRTRPRLRVNGDGLPSAARRGIPTDLVVDDHARAPEGGPGECPGLQGIAHPRVGRCGRTEHAHATVRCGGGLGAHPVGDTLGDARAKEPALGEDLCKGSFCSIAHSTHGG